MGYKILIIEDDPDLQENFKEILEFNRFQVQVASDGNEALQLISTNLFDLIISDIVMPGMDGLNFLAEVKKKTNYSNTPFIFLSAKVTKEDQRNGIELGADDYLLKPVTSKMLLQAIFSSLEKSKKREEWANSRLESALEKDRKITLHEFRTPLAGVLNVFEVMESMLDSFDKNEFQELIQNGRNSANRINESLTKLSLYNRINRIEAVLIPFHLDLEFLKSLFPESFKRFYISSWSDPAIITADLDLFKFVIKELLGNAIKFSDSTYSIHLTFEEGILRISNSQSLNKVIGPFIPKAFSQVDRKFAEQQGLGLGLFLATEIVSLHGGLLTCEIDTSYKFIVTVDLSSLVQKVV